MQPIHELLNRIKWDSEFGKGDFEIGVYDRVEGKVIRLPFAGIQFIPGEHDLFYYMDADGEEHSVPLHRIKAVYRDGERIWHREH